MKDREAMEVKAADVGKLEEAPAIEYLDADGNAVAAGDVVLVRCVVVQAAKLDRAGFWNLDLETVRPMTGTEKKLKLRVHSSQVEKA